MKRKKKQPDAGKQAEVVAEARRAQALRKGTYREQAFALFPHVCGRCGREFSGKRLRELTVHHRDHDHDNNPADGSNWELLCLYCHDDEHQDSMVRDGHGVISRAVHREEPLAHNPFGALKSKLKGEEGEPDSE